MSPPLPLGRFQPNLIGLFLGRFYTNIAQTVALRCTKWLPELKIEKKKPFKQHLLHNHWADFNQTYRIVLWEVLYQNCSNLSALLNKMAKKAKNKKKNTSVSLKLIVTQHTETVKSPEQKIEKKNFN